jgi:hypothetical protein
MMFETPSSLNELREALNDNLDNSEYFLGIHALFEGEVIFARDVVHLNLELPAFPVDAEAVWDWFNDNLSGSKDQRTYVYQLPFAIDSEDDDDMEALMALSRTSPMTVWMLDLARQEDPEAGQRYVVITIPTKQAARDFETEYDGKDARALLA